MQKKLVNFIQPIALVLIFCIAITFFASVGFILVNADHYCIGETCKTCEEIFNCINILKKFSDYFISDDMSLSIFSITLLCLSLLIDCSNKEVKTLVKLKVRLNN